MLKMCTGYYINYYSSTSSEEIFIIINEANGAVGTKKLYKAEEICEEHMREGHMDKDTRKKLQDKLEDIFEYGVQIYIVDKSGRMNQFAE